MMEEERHMRPASMAKAVVKSSQAKGNLLLSVVNSRIRMRQVTKKQKHQVNMHHAQYGDETCPTVATRMKVRQVRTTEMVRSIPTGWVSERKSTVTIAKQILTPLQEWKWNGNAVVVPRFFLENESTAAEAKHGGLICAVYGLGLIRGLGIIVCYLLRWTLLPRKNLLQKFLRQ